MKRLFVIFLAAATLFILVTILIKSPPPQNANAGELKTFSSKEELASYIQRNMQLSRQFDFFYSGAIGTRERIAAPQSMPKTENVPALAPNATAGGDLVKSPADYSTTNIQVEGVDEGDIVKSDGQYLYVLAGNKVFIVEAYPAEKARIISEISFEGQPRELFINKNKLVVFGDGPVYAYPEETPAPGLPRSLEHSERRVPRHVQETFIRVYDTSDKKMPLLKRDLTCQGNYNTSRLIEDYAYTIINMPVIWHQNIPGDVGNKNDPAPRIELPQLSIDGKLETVPPPQIYYFDYPDRSYQYTTIISINTQNDEEQIKNKTFLTGLSQNIYASRQNIYLTGAGAPDFRSLTTRFLDELASFTPVEIQTKIDEIKNSDRDAEKKIQEVSILLEDYLDVLNDPEAAVLEEKILASREKWQTEIARQRNKTIIYKLAATNGEINYQCRGETPGEVLNQFSMDEHNGLFRIATTTQSFLFHRQPNTRNNIFVLDEGLQIIGRLQGLAPTERIYAARFMGDRAYLVTFRRIDPLFVIDLKDPCQPRVLGELKIPGYSDYLHPYDENHLIGIGKEVIEEPIPMPFPREKAKEIFPPPTREQGIKVALFDVSDPQQPKEIAKYVIAGPHADSLALRDHKAVLFSRAKNLLAIPLFFPPAYKIMEQTEMEMPLPGTGIIAPEPKRIPFYRGWQGVYVFTLSLDSGLKLRGKITHLEDFERGFIQEKAAKRSLYINNVLYTVSDRLIKMNDLDNLKEINHIWLP